ncbi:glycosyltransferase [bacterium]|nr:glycosyltransferase [bacterium]
MKAGTSIVIVSFNSAETIAECLLSVARTMRPCDEAIVIDNHSQDHTIEIIQGLDLPPKIQLCPLSHNAGFSKGCNIGIEKTSREFIILLNPDTSVFGDWISRLTGHFKYYDRTGAVGPLSNSVIQTQHILTYLPQYHDYLQRADDLFAKLSELFGRRSFPTNMLIGFCMALRRDLVERHGGLDEDIFLGDDDLEISWRLREKGFYLRIALDVFVNHSHHTSFNTLPENVTNKYVQEGSDVLYEKMRSHYAPDMVPHPLDYFGIGWWEPSVLKQTSEVEAFRPKLTANDYRRVLVTAKNLLQTQSYEEAVDVLEAALKFYVRDFGIWYTLGSIYMKLREFDQAESALLNAWALEFDGDKAKTRLRTLLGHRGQEDKYWELIGSEQT